MVRREVCRCSLRGRSSDYNANLHKRAVQGERTAAEPGTAQFASMCAPSSKVFRQQIGVPRAGSARAWMHSCGSRYLKPSSGGRGTDVTKRSSAARSSSVKPDTACQAAATSDVLTEQTEETVTKDACSGSCDYSEERSDV